MDRTANRCTNVSDPASLPTISKDFDGLKQVTAANRDMKRSESFEVQRAFKKGATHH